MALAGFHELFQIPSICPRLQDGKIGMAFVQYIMVIDERIFGRFVSAHPCIKSLRCMTNVFHCLFTDFMRAYECIHKNGGKAGETRQNQIAMARNRDCRVLKFSFADTTMAYVVGVSDPYL